MLPGTLSLLVVSLELFATLSRSGSSGAAAMS